jgi:hypothetical protein
MPAPKVGDRVVEGRRFGEVVALRPQNMVDVVFSDLDYPIRRPAGALTVMQRNPKPKMPVFIAAVLTPDAKKKLYRWWSTQPLAPDPLPITKSTHMTIQFRPSLADVAAAPIGSDVMLQITGWAADNQIQAVSVKPQGVGSANAVPHVTFAIKDASVAPKLSNDLFVTPGVKKKEVEGPLLAARVGWSDGGTYHYEMPEGVQSNPGPRGGLTAREREQLEGSAFALPGRRWPINDRRHAVIAMQYMLRGFGSASDYPSILKAIAKRYPMSDKRNAEIWTFYGKHKQSLGRRKIAANPSTDLAAASKYLEVAYDDAPAYFAAEPLSVKIRGKQSQFEGRWVMPGGPLSRVSAVFGEAVANFMADKFRGGEKNYRPTRADREAVFERVNRSSGSPFTSLEDFERQQKRAFERFEKFMNAFHAAPPAVQRELTTTLQLRTPLRKGVIDLHTNPAEDVYDPAKEQFRSVVQGVYESQVRKSLRLPYNAPFTDARGHRLDSSLDDGAKRKLLSSAYAIATRQGQKHGWLMPGTQTPTEKGQARAFERLSQQQAEHAAQNRMDYERTLGAARKSGYYRVVAEEVTTGSGRKALQYKVQPTPPREAGLPAYRLSQRAAEQDAAKAERFRSSAPSQARLRMNPDRTKRREQSPGTQGELEYMARMEDFLDKPVAEAREAFRWDIDNHVRVESSLRRQIAEKGLDWDDDSEQKAVAVSRRIVNRNRAFLEKKYEARESDLEDMKPSMDEKLTSAQRIAPDPMLFKQIQHIRTLQRRDDPLFRDAMAKWIPHRNMLDIETVRAMTEGAKLGGIAGSGKNRKDSDETGRVFIPALQALNAASRSRGEPELTDDTFAVIEPKQAIDDFLRATSTEEELAGKIRLDDIPLELRSNIVEERDKKGRVTKMTLVLPYMQLEKGVIAPVEGEGKSEQQENALDRAQEQRETKKLIQTVQRGFDANEPFWDVERTVLLYFPKKDEKGQPVVGSSGYPLKQYVNYTMRPKQTLEQVFEETGFRPFAVPSGKEGQVSIERPEIQMRYVMYIPRVRRAIVRKLKTGIAQTLSTADIQNLKAVRSPKGLGLRLEQLPEQTGRRKRTTPYWSDRGITDPDIVSVYPSMILSKYFVVTDENGIGAEGKKAAADTDLLESAATTAQRAAEMAEAVGTVDALTVEGVPIEQLMLQRQRERNAAARAKGKTTKDSGRVFLSPENNWVKYNKLSNSFRRLRKGRWDENANEGRGGYVDGVEIPQYDVFYTLSAPLAYLTFKYFNTPDALPHVEAKMEDVANVLKVLAPKRVPNSKTREVEEYEQVEPVRVGSIAVIGLDQKLADVLRRPSERPVRSRAETLGGLSVSESEFMISPLNLLMVGDLVTAQEQARKHAAMREQGLEDRLSLTLKLQEQAHREGTRVGEFQGRQVYALPSPKAPEAATPVGESDFDLDDLLGNPRPRRSAVHRTSRKRY